MKAVKALRDAAPGLSLSEAVALVKEAVSAPEDSRPVEAGPQ